MRAGILPRTIPIIIVFMLAILLLGTFCYSEFLAKGEDTSIYLEADLDTPSTVQYTGSAVDFSYTLWQSTDQKVSWFEDENAAHTAIFEIRYYNSSNVLISAPSEVGSYTAKVAAIAAISGYKNSAGYFIDTDVVICGKSFNIVYEQVTAVYGALEGEDCLRLGTVTDWYSGIVGGTKVYIGGTLYPTGGGTDCTVAIQYYGGTWENTATVAAIGSYRVVLTFLESADLTDTIAPVTCGSVMYRYFEVKSEGITLSLDESGDYTGDLPIAKLHADSVSMLNAAGISNYNTTLYSKETTASGAVTLRQVDTASGAGEFSAEEVGSYIYRVSFNADYSAYGISANDYYDLTYTTEELPYYVLYYINTDGQNLDDELQYTVHNTSGYTVEILPIFYNSDGSRLSNVYNASDGSKKYSVTYKMYNELYAEKWVDLETLSMTKPQVAGRYQVIITFADSATVNGEYTIANDTVITYEFEIVDNPLQVIPLSGGVNYYTGSAVVPSLAFTHTSGTVTAVVSGKYTINYYQLNGTLIGTTAPSAVGTYQGEIVFTEDIAELSIEAGYVTRFYYTVQYSTLVANFVCSGGTNAVIAFTNGVSGQTVSLIEGVDYTVTYYSKDGTVYADLSVAPSVAGDYRAQITYLTDFDTYNIAGGDITYYDYTVSGNDAWVSYSTSFINLEYDGGYKVAAYSFFVGATSVALTELVDYKVTYYKFNSATELYDIITDYPKYAGKYKQTITFLKTDVAKGITAGVTSSYTYTIAACSIQVSHLEETALVYDNTQKGFTAAMVKGTRPFFAAYNIFYAVSTDGTPVFAPEEKSAAGSYLAEIRLADTEQDSLMLTANTWSFVIEKLSLTVTFDVPVGADAMFVDLSTSVVPAVTYAASNGIYSEAVTAAITEWTARGINIGAVTSYYTSIDGVAYNVAATPELPDNYQIVIECGNSDNIIFSEAVSICDNNEITLPIASIKDGKAVTVYTIYSRLVKAEVEFAGSLYYDGEQKGVESVSFYAYNSATGLYDVSVTPVFGSDYTIYYYASDYDGNVSSSGTTIPPVIKSYYVARITLNDFAEGTAPQYVTDKYYSFAEGKDANGVSLEGSAIASGSYVDFIFRIRDQEKLDVIFDMPLSFAADGNSKEISVTYLNQLETVMLSESVDYEILYYNSEGVSSPTGYSDVGTYRIRVYFLLENTMYRFNNYPGTYYTDYPDDLYITAGDYIEYEYIIFQPYSMQVSFNAPSSLYFTGSTKAYTVSFTVQSGSEVSNVVLTYGTHYKLVYYAKDGNGLYSKLASAPIVPNQYGYAVEVAFLCDLLDYSIDVDGEDKIITLTEFTTIAQGGGIIDNAVSPNCTFEISKAVLVVNGISAANKQFDNTRAATLSGTPVLNIKTDEYGIPMGALVTEAGNFIYTLQGTINGEFITCMPSDNVSVNLTSLYYLSGDGADYYLLEYADIFANITKRTVQVTPQDISREYNPFAVESTINYTYEAGNDVLVSLLGAATEHLFVGALARSAGTAVGAYPISIGTLELDDSLSEGLLVEGVPVVLSDLFAISLTPSNYKITKRQITIALLAGQNKIYGEVDPELLISVTSGTLIYNDELVGAPIRAAGENVGVYAVSLGGIKICDSQSVDVSSNYSITLTSGNFQIVKKTIKIAAVNQENVLYTTAFDNKLVNVLYGATNVTDSYVTNPIGDRVSGSLALQETENYLIYTIAQGSITIVNSSGRNVSKNYNILFYTGTYSIQKVVVNVRITDSPTLTKYYGDADPIIGFTVLNSEVLGSKYTIAAVSSVGRALGEDAGEYRLLSNNDSSSFIVKSNGKNVSKYFEFNVSGIATGTKFTIMPRPITVTVADMDIENTGRTIIPTVRYLNSDGSSLSRTILANLKVNFTVSSNIKYKEGKNSVPPMISGEVTEDSNFIITIKEGTITVTYLQNIVSAEAVEADDDIYTENKYVLAGLMLYKTVKIYKLSTASGGSPSHDVRISLPVTDDITGKQLVAVALYSDSKTAAFQLYDGGEYLIYTDGDAYYVALSTAEEWFYIIWGVVIIVGGVAIYFLTILTIKIVKKVKIKLIATAPQRAAKKAEKDKLKRQKTLAKGDKVRSKVNSKARNKGGFVPTLQKSKADTIIDEVGNLSSSADLISDSPEISQKSEITADSGAKVKIKNAHSSKKPKGFVPVNNVKPVGKKGKNKVNVVNSIDEDAAIAAIDMFADSNSEVVSSLANRAALNAKPKDKEVKNTAKKSKDGAAGGANSAVKKSSGGKKKGAYKPKGFIPSASNKPRPMFDDVPTALPSMTASKTSDSIDISPASFEDMFADTNTSYNNAIDLDALKNKDTTSNTEDEIIVSNNTFFDDEEESKDTDEDSDMY